MPQETQSTTKDTGGRRRRFLRGLWFIGLALLIVYLSAFGLKLQTTFQSHNVTRFTFLIMFGVLFLWLFYEHAQRIREDWKELQKWDISGNEPLNSAIQVYYIFRLYTKTKRVFAYGSLGGAMAILFGIGGLFGLISMNGGEPNSIWALISSTNLLISLGEIVLGGLSLVFSYRIGRQMLPAKLLIGNVLYLILDANKGGGDTMANLEQQRDKLLSKIETEHVHWFE